MASSAALVVIWLTELQQAPAMNCGAFSEAESPSVKLWKTNLRCVGTLVQPHLENGSRSPRQGSVRPGRAAETVDLR